MQAFTHAYALTARRWAHHTPNFKSLPEHKKKTKKAAYFRPFYAVPACCSRSTKRKRKKPPLVQLFYAVLVCSKALRSFAPAPARQNRCFSSLSTLQPDSVQTIPAPPLISVVGDLGCQAALGALQGVVKNAIWPNQQQPQPAPANINPGQAAPNSATGIALAAPGALRIDGQGPGHPPSDA